MERTDGTFVTRDHGLSERTNRGRRPVRAAVRQLGRLLVTSRLHAALLALDAANHCWYRATCAGD